jgi:pyridoxamine 5'-phosphate oxidase
MGVLDADNLDIDPYQLFDSWFAEAKKSEINDADAMAIASVDSDGMPSVRMVLLKEVTSEGFVFYTNYTSRKASELLATGKAAFVMHWKSLRRQVRVSGKVEQVPAEQSDAYFASRPRGSQIGAWASDQSKALDSRKTLEQAVADAETRYPQDIPRPPHWGGFLIRPDEIEFWADGEYRLHDRFRYTRNATGIWQAARLYP